MCDGGIDDIGLGWVSTQEFMFSRHVRVLLLFAFLFRLDQPVIVEMAYSSVITKLYH